MTDGRKKRNIFKPDIDPIAGDILLLRLKVVR